MTVHLIQHVQPKDEIMVAKRFAEGAGAQVIFGKEVTVILTPPQMVQLVDQLQAFIDAHLAAHPVSDKVVQLRRPEPAPPEPPCAA